jgi:hypothetical protein
LSLITARETELASAAGRESKVRPHFIDEQKKKSVVVKLDSSFKPTNKPSE